MCERSWFFRVELRWNALVLVLKSARSVIGGVGVWSKDVNDGSFADLFFAFLSRPFYCLALNVDWLACGVHSMAVV